MGLSVSRIGFTPSNSSVETLSARARSTRSAPGGYLRPHAWSVCKLVARYLPPPNGRLQ